MLSLERTDAIIGSNIPNKYCVGPHLAVEAQDPIRAP